MSAELIDGKKISEQIRAEVKASVQDLKAKGIVPGLAAVLVGDNPASQIYVRSKAKACDEAGIYSEVLKYPKEMKESELL